MSHLFTDADNTLWDTDGLFAEAQLEMLHELEALAGVAGRDSDLRGLAFLRNIDQTIAATHPSHLQYPPMLLARGVLGALSNQDESSETVSASVNKTRLQDIVDGFTDHLRRIPKLREGVREGLAAAIDEGIAVTIVTESTRERCLARVAAHELDELVSDIVSATKTPRFFTLLREQSRGKCFMVGDQLDRDIAFSQPAGFETFHYPSSFVPYWINDVHISPDHIITRYDALVPYLVR